MSPAEDRISLREYIERIIELRHEQTAAALIAVKEQTKANFEASEKAIVKAEDAQKSYNATHNELSRKLDEQNKATMPRPEVESVFRAQNDKIEKQDERIAALERTIAAGAGRSGGIGASWGALLGVVGLVGGLIAIFVALSKG